MARTNQRGSVLEFIIIGSVMAILLVGGAYLVRRTLMSAGDDNKISLVEDENGDNYNDSGDAVEGPDDESNKDSNDSSNEDTVDQIPGGTSTDTDNSSNPSQPTPGSDNLPQTGQDSASPETLPQTGPVDIAVNGLLLGGVVAAGTAYRRSRKLPTTL